MARGRPARRLHTQGTCGFLIRLRPGPNANDPRLFLESMFIDQATLNGTRPNSPIGDEPATTQMIHGASDSPIGNHRALRRLLPVVDGLGPAPPRAVGRPARRLHTQGTCGFLIGLRPVPTANDPRRKGPSDTEGRDLTAPAGRWTWPRASRGSTHQAAPHARHMRLSHRAASRT